MNSWSESMAIHKPNMNWVLIVLAVLWISSACTSTHQIDTVQQPKKTQGERQPSPGGTPDSGETDSFGFGPDAPAWAREGRVPNYPLDLYIVGLGYSPNAMPESDAHSQARLQAFKEISDQVETLVSNEFTSIQRSVFQNENLDELVDVKSVTKQVTKELLGGAEIVKRYYDPDSGTAAAVAVMDRAKLSSRLVKEAGDARSQFDGHMKGYEEAAEKNDPSLMLKSLIHAQTSMEKVVKSHLKAIAVGVTKQMSDQLAQMSDPEASARMIRELGALRDRIHIEPVSGQEQRASLTGNLREPVVVKAVWESENGPMPVTAFPVEAMAADSDKATIVPGSNTTDAEGCFSFTVQELKATGSASNTIKVRLNFQEVEKKSTATAPSLDVVYFMPTKDTTRVGVLIYETIDGEENKKPYTASAINKALDDIGFDMIRLKPEAPVGDVVDMSQSELETMFGETCHYLIVGTAESEKSSQEGGLVFYRARLTLSALELDTGKSIIFEVPFEKGKGGSNTDSKAMRASFNKVAEQLIGSARKKTTGLLTQKFIDRFTSGAEWSDE